MKTLPIDIINVREGSYPKTVFFGENVIFSDFPHPTIYFMGAFINLDNKLENKVKKKKGINSLPILTFSHDSGRTFFETKYFNRLHELYMEKIAGLTSGSAILDNRSEWSNGLLSV